MPIRMKYGTGFKWGNGWKWGYGTSEPWVPIGNDPVAVDRFSIESLQDPTPLYSLAESSIFQVDAQGAYSVRYGLGLPDERFYLVSPNGTSWRVTANGTTGLVTVDDGLTGTPVGVSLTDPAGTLWLFSVSNTGVLTLSNGPTSLTIETATIPTYTVEG